MRNKLFLVFVVFVFIFFLSSCRIKAHDWAEDGCDWICDSPYIIIYKSPKVWYDENNIETKVISGYMEIDDNLVEVVYAQDNTLKTVDLMFYNNDKNHIFNDDIIFSAEVNLKDDLMYWYITYSIYDQYLNKTLVFYKEYIS